MEQCWRDVLQLLWGLRGHDEEFYRRVPATQPLKMASMCCNQFLLSKDMVRKRSLHVWKELLHMIAVQPTCHIGAPDYDHLSQFVRTGQKDPPEEEFYAQLNESKEYRTGAAISGGTVEHLSHVIFGHQPLQMTKPTQEEMCQNFIKGCPGSPCQ